MGEHLGDYVLVKTVKQEVDKDGIKKYRWKYHLERTQDTDDTLVITSPCDIEWMIPKKSPFAVSFEQMQTSIEDHGKKSMVKKTAKKTKKSE